jgi:hypothetical protein
VNHVAGERAVAFRSVAVEQVGLLLVLFFRFIR